MQPTIHFITTIKGVIMGKRRNEVGNRHKAHIHIRINPKILYRDQDYWWGMYITEWYGNEDGCFEAEVSPMYGFVGGNTRPFTRYGEDLKETWSCPGGPWFEGYKGKEWNKW
jgi:hypothetical protein